MGDLNDNPWDKTIQGGFKLAKYYNHTPTFVNLMNKDKDKRGSYTFMGKMLNFDQMIVSYDLIQKIDTASATSHIFMQDFLIDNNPNQTMITPFSTYKGFKYQGGISDHFPIYLKLITPKN